MRGAGTLIGVSSLRGAGIGDSARRGAGLAAEGASSSSSFVPTDIAGLEFWLDFSDLSTLYQDAAKTTPVASDGDPLGAIEDKSGNGRDFTQATAGVRFTYQENIQNALSVGRSAATAHNLSNAALPTSAAQTLIVVLAKRSAPTATRMIAWARGSTNFVYTDSDDDATQWWYYTPGTDINTTCQAWHVLTMKYVSTSSLIIYADGVQVASLNPNVGYSTSANLFLGGRTVNGGEGGDFDYGWVFRYPSALSDGDRETAEAGAMAYWGIS